MKAGAAATVIYNNESANNLMMNLADYEYKNPAVLIPMISAGSILAASEKDETTACTAARWSLPTRSAP